MRDKLLLVGAGGLGRVTLEHATLAFDCSFVDDGYPAGTEICGVPVVGDIQDLAHLRKEYTHLVVTIGDNRLREKIYRQTRDLVFAFPNVVARSAYVSPFSQLGWGCILLNNAVVQNGAQIGNGVVLTVRRGSPSRLHYLRLCPGLHQFRGAHRGESRGEGQNRQHLHRGQLRASPRGRCHTGRRVHPVFQ